MAFQARREGRPAPPTIYGRLEFDLSMSLGPVPITFTTEPQNNIPANITCVDCTQAALVKLKGTELNNIIDLSQPVAEVCGADFAGVSPH